MGKKAKVGKARKDKFYQLAKETGYRSRAAFKLIQLNRKFEFLQKSRVVIDLCAAPGGWLQVAAENTPVSSLIVGVDLVPIRPIPRTITLQEDITTDKCRQALKKELQTWQADCVLNDGAPNVGKSWVHDAFQQAELTLSALKLATEFLHKGGWFVTKLFRSKDYFALLWVFQQLFKHVHATKPQASRTESAEIFVVCQHYLAPTKLDPKFLDPKHVFKDVTDEQPKQSINLIHPEKKQRHREGYAEGDYTLYHQLNASEFLQSDDFMEKLASSSEVVLDSEEISDHPATTTEIKECCKDIRVLGRKEIKSLFAWRKALLKDLSKPGKENKTPENGPKAEVKETMSESEQEEQEMQETLAKALEEERKQHKRKKRKERKMKSKLQQRKDLKMILPNDRLDYGDDAGVFSLSKIRSKQQLDEVQEGDLSFMDGDVVEDEEEEKGPTARKKRKLMEMYDKDSKDYLDPSEMCSDEEGEEEPEFSDDEVAADSVSQQSGETDDNNPLVVELDSKDNKARSRAAAWFSKEVFGGLEKDDDEDVEIEAMTANYQERGGTILGKRDDSPSKKKVHFADDVREDEDSDYDVDEFVPSMSKKEPTKHKLDKKAEFEVAKAESDVQRLDPEGLAIGAAMVHSKKRRREIIDRAYHKYMFNDEGLPEWFAKDEARHCKKQMPVTKEEVQEYMLKARAADARPIRKIAEAKARKKRKLVKRLEKARKKAEKVTEEEGVSEREKMQQVKQLYKKAGLLSRKKQEVTYVVAKKGMGKRVRRPHGVSGRFKVVDPRMKKDSQSGKAVKNRAKGKPSNKKQGKKR